MLASWQHLGRVWWIQPTCKRHHGLYRWSSTTAAKTKIQHSISHVTFTVEIYTCTHCFHHDGTHGCFHYWWLFVMSMVWTVRQRWFEHAQTPWSMAMAENQRPPPPHTHTIIEQTHNTPKHNSTHTLCLDGLSINSQQKTLTEIIDSLSPWQIPLGKQKHLKTKTKRQQTVPFVQPGLLQLIREVMDAKDGAVTPVLIKISQLLVPNFEVLVSGWHALCHCLRERKNPRKTGKKRQSHSGVTCPVSLPERNEKHV